MPVTGRIHAGPRRARLIDLARWRRPVEARMVMSATSPLPHNPGPSWGYSFLLWAERWWPRWFFRLMLMAGTWVGVALMPAQRAHSRAYLSVVLGRPPGLQDVWRHFFAFADFLVLKLRTGRGAAVRCVLEPENKEAFEALLDSGQPALFGTFHFGASDLLGDLLGERGIRGSIRSAAFWSRRTRRRSRRCWIPASPPSSARFTSAPLIYSGTCWANAAYAFPSFGCESATPTTLDRNSPGSARS